MEYKEFLRKKQHSSIEFGIDPVFVPDYLFDFQSYATRHALKKGRCAVFFDTGLGKTLMELVIARNYREVTNKPVLIITPLAVAFQFVKECNRFDISSIEYSKDGRYSSDIVVCNYERLDKFNSDDFDCVILDESSILKNFKGAIKGAVTAFMKKVKYRYLFTATPSPNDFIELGTSSEALGYMGYTDMLTKFFTNNEDTISPQNIGTQWILKGHAQETFFEWVSTWSISMRKPSDLGFSDEAHVLPGLNLQYHSVKNTTPLVIGGQHLMFNIVAKTMKEILAESRNTVRERCEKAAELSALHDISVLWCNRNDESSTLREMCRDAHEIKGSMTIDQKEEVLLAFADGHIKKLITKPKMTAFGLNWQHCNHTTFFPTFSYEQYYQAIRRFWRYGQEREVLVDLIYSDGQSRILESLMAKTKKANDLFDKLNSAINTGIKDKVAAFDTEIILPTFL